MLGQGTVLLIEAFGFIGQGRIRVAETVAQARQIGTGSLWMVLLLSALGGAVLALQTAEKFAQTGADSYVGGLVALAIVREIAPIFTAMAVGARAGTAIAAELAGSELSQQIAALQMMHINPVRYLVVPRLLASLWMLPCLTLAAEVVGNLTGMLTARAVSGLRYPIYLESIWLTLKPYDLMMSLVKGAVFGVLMAMTACTLGLTVKGGAKEVGQAATRAAAWTAVLVILTDFAMSWWFFQGSQVF